VAEDINQYECLIAKLKQFQSVSEKLETLKSQISALEQKKHNAAQELDEARMFLAFSLAIIAGQLGADFLKMCGKAIWGSLVEWGRAVKYARMK
jgi:DNA repair ATPase RecN